MRYFTKEEIDALRIAETHFHTAVKMDYKLHTPSSMNKLVEDTYKAAGGNLHFNWGCSRCAYQAYKTIGKWYFESIENLPKDEIPVIDWIEPNKIKARVKNDNAKRATEGDGSSY